IPNVRITILGYNYEHLASIAEDLGRRLSQYSRVQMVDTNANNSNLRDRAQQFVLRIDRNAVDRHQITVSETIQLVSSRLRGGAGAGSVVVGGEPVRYELKLEGYRQADVDDL